MIRQRIKRILTRASDIVFHGRNKALILIGTDRKDRIDTGYGDQGEEDVDSSVIDLVAGYDPDSQNPNYRDDKSRIYIAEKTDPDDYFGITLGDSVEGEPAIIQTSDNVYIRARSKIKIVNGDMTILISDGNVEIKSPENITLNAGSSNLVMDRQGRVRIGTLGSGEDFVALARLVLQELNSIRNIIRLHVHPIAGPTSTGPTNILIPDSNPVAASNTRAD